MSYGYGYGYGLFFVSNQDSVRAVIASKHNQKGLN
jgi:hypothetical protein